MLPVVLTIAINLIFVLMPIFYYFKSVSVIITVLSFREEFFMFFKKLWSNILGTQKEQSTQDQLSLAIQAFWKQVKTSEQSFNKLELIDIMETLNNLLNENQLDVIAEVTQGSKKNHKIIFTSDGKIEQFEQVMEITKQAPDLNFFEIEAFRQRTKNVDSFTIQLRDDSFSLGTTDLLIQYKKDHRKISLGILFGKTIPEEMLTQAQTMALIILDHILGEYDLAVRVVAIEFLEVAQDTVTTMPANEFVTIFDSIWKEDLKHTGVFPNNEEDQWIVFELASHNESNGNMLVHRNEAANALVGHTNYCYALNIIADVNSKAVLSLVYELEDAINIALRTDKRGIHCQNSFSQGTRNMLWHVGDKHLALQLTQQIAKQYKTLSVKIECNFDPYWSQYLSWVE